MKTRETEDLISEDLNIVIQNRTSMFFALVFERIHTYGLLDFVIFVRSPFPEYIFGKTRPLRLSLRWVRGVFTIMRLLFFEISIRANRSESWIQEFPRLLLPHRLIHIINMY